MGAVRTSCGRALILGATILAGIAGAGHAADGPGPAGAVGPGNRNFGGWAVSRHPYTITGNGTVGTTVGRYTFFSDGLVATRVGNATAWNNGLVSTRIGRNEIFSNGMVGVPTRGGMVFTPGFGADSAPAGSRAARHHAGHPDAGPRGR